MNIWKTAAILSAALMSVAGFALAKVSLNPADIDKGVNILKSGAKVADSMRPINEKEEMALGHAIASEVFVRYGKMVESERLNKYITMVGKTVAAKCDRPGVTYRFALIDNQQANAFAAPGGYIFITTGLILKLKTESQLAGVLAHEVAHSSRKHMLETIQRSKQLAGLTTAAATALDKDPKALSQVVNLATDTLFTKGLDKKYEFDADKFGVAYAAASGYDPKGLPEFLAKLKEDKGKGGSIFFSTHPPLSERIARLRKEELPKHTKSGQILAERFAANIE